MKYADIKALLRVNRVLKATRKEWDNKAYIIMEGDHIVITRQHIMSSEIMFTETIYTPTYQDLISDDWEIIS